MLQITQSNPDLFLSTSSDTFEMQPLVLVVPGSDSLESDESQYEADAVKLGKLKIRNS